METGLVWKNWRGSCCWYDQGNKSVEGGRRQRGVMHHFKGTTCHLCIGCLQLLEVAHNLRRNLINSGSFTSRQPIKWQLTHRNSARAFLFYALISLFEQQHTLRQGVEVERRRSTYWGQRFAQSVACLRRSWCISVAPWDWNRQKQQTSIRKNETP